MIYVKDAAVIVTVYGLTKVKLPADNPETADKTGELLTTNPEGN